MYDGAAFEGFPSYEEGTTPIYRLGRGDGSHVFMASGPEMDNALALYGFTNEGVKFYAKPTQTGDARPVYRLSKNGKYFYTVNIFEKDDMVQRGYTNEGVLFYIRSSSTNSPVYRLSRNGVHLYTMSAIERDIAKLGGNIDEGIAFSAQTAPTTDALPVYRLVRNGRYIFTPDRGERDALVLLQGYESEGAAFYGYPAGYAGTQAIHRADRDAPEDHLYTMSSMEAQIAADNHAYRNKHNSFNQ
jgi:hypothetical protein